MNHHPEAERPLPHRNETEQLLLGAILAGHRNREILLDSLSAEEFFLPRHHEILRAMLDLRAGGKPVDLLTVSAELGRTGNLEAAGGIAYLAQLGDDIPRALDLSYHVHELKSLAQRRRMIHALDELSEAAFGREESTEELLDRGIERLSDIAREADADRDETMGFRDAAAALLANLQSDSGPRIFTELAGLDEVTGGFRPGELVILTGGTGHGKTLLVQQMRRRACRDGHHVLFCSGEMLAPQLVSRELAAEARVKPWKMRLSERLDEDDWRRLTEAASKECNLCRILDKELSLARFRRVARRLKAKCALGLLLVDYDELVEAPGEDELEQQRNLVRGAKSLAMELQIPVTIVSQLRKPLAGADLKKPMLASLYGSGAKSKHPSWVIFVDRPYVRELAGDETEARVFVLKARDGKVGRVRANFNIETLRFESPAEENTIKRRVTNAPEMSEGKLPSKD